MAQSRFVSEFHMGHKDTPMTALPDREPSSPSCQFCKDNLTTTTTLRKNQIILELQLQQLKQQVSTLQKQKQTWINSKVLTYHQYQTRLQSENIEYWNRQDIEAQLFEAKVIIELLLVSKSVHPQIKLITDESLRQKYSDLLLENLRLREMVEGRDRVIAERGMFPIYHYDKRVQTLRKAVGFWYRKAEEECVRMKGRCRDMKLRLEEEKNCLREELRKEFISNQEKVSKVEELIIHCDRSMVVQKKVKQPSLLIPLQQQRKKNHSHNQLASSKVAELKKMR